MLNDNRTPLEIQRKLRKGIDLTEEEQKIMTNQMAEAFLKNPEPKIDLGDDFDELNREGSA